MDMTEKLTVAAIVALGAGALIAIAGEIYRALRPRPDH